MDDHINANRLDNILPSVRPADRGTMPADGGAHLLPIYPVRPANHGIPTADHGIMTADHGIPPANPDIPPADHWEQLADHVTLPAGHGITIPPPSPHQSKMLPLLTPSIMGKVLEQDGSIVGQLLIVLAENGSEDSVLKRPVRPKLLKTGQDGQTPSFRE